MGVCVRERERGRVMRERENTTRWRYEWEIAMGGSCSMNCNGKERKNAMDEKENACYGSYSVSRNNERERELWKKERTQRNKTLWERDNAYYGNYNVSYNERERERESYEERTKEIIKKYN